MKKHLDILKCIKEYFYSQYKNLYHSAKHKEKESTKKIRTMPDERIILVVQYLYVCGGFIVVAAGTFGNIVNVITFTCLKRYRSLTSSIFLAGVSFCEELTVIGLIFPVALGYATGIDPRAASRAYCKAGSILYTGGGSCALMCLYLTAFDRYLQTSRSATKRQWMTIRKALLLFCTSIFLSALISLPFGIFRDVFTDPLRCDYDSAEFNMFASFFYGGIGIAFPSILIGVLGYLTWRNVQQTQQRQTGSQNTNSIAQQVTRMILIQTTSIVISLIPAGAFQVYCIFTNKGIYQFTDVELLVFSITQVLVFTDAFISFYVYFIVSPTFRKSVKEMLCCKLKRIGVAH